MERTRNSWRCPLFGVLCDLKDNILPTYEDVMKFYEWTRHSLKYERETKKEPTYKEIEDIVVTKLMEIWEKLSVPTVEVKRMKERYKTDINLAIQLLQCKPESFVPQKISSLPIDIQSKVSAYMRLDTHSHSDSEGSINGEAITTSTPANSTSTTAYKVLPATDSPPPEPCPFPPTAMVYSMRGLDAKLKDEISKNLNNANKTNNNAIATSDNNSDILNNNNGIQNSLTSLNTTQDINDHQPQSYLSPHHLNDNDMLSPVVMAKFLEEELKAGEVKHCGTCHCAKDLTVLADLSRSYSVATQTPFMLNETAANAGGAVAGNNDTAVNQLCLRCYSNLNSPSRTNSPYTRHMMKSSDSVISETKSSVSDLNDLDKLFIPVKKDDLMVNPILGHHRLSERTAALLKRNAAKSGELADTAAADGPTVIKSSYNAIIENIKSTSITYQRRFVDGGGTALDLLEERITQKSALNKVKILPTADINGNEDLEDEQKPLLSETISHGNLCELKEKDYGKTKIKLRTESSCELERTALKSPAASFKSTSLKQSTTHGDLLKAGSVNSVWSKTSSCEGNKMFENFNRNLIKTIKAENPKYRGPRLCAMRIQQNGQSNVLLDNIESIEAMQPIIYRRRERLLDEELEDGKEVITSKTTMESNTTEQAKEAVEESENPAQDNNVNFKEDTGGGSAAETTKEECEAKDNIIKASTNADDLIPPAATLEGMCDTNAKQPAAGAQQISISHSTNAENLIIKKTETNIETNSNSNNNKSLNINKLALNTSMAYDNSSKTSGSLSENINYQETVNLKRQQLSRVAEWVQKNTQQMEMQQQQQQQQQQNPITSLNACDASVIDHQSSSFSTLDQLDSVSVEKLSTDSGYKTTPQLQQMHTNNSSQDEITMKTSEHSLSPKSDMNQAQQQQQQWNNDSPTTTHNSAAAKQIYYRRTSRSGLPVPYTATTDCSVQDTCSQSSPPTTIIPDQPTCDILNYKYYPNDSDKTRSIKAELHTTSQSVDIAQMEYNVKQFLLKQNEWSTMMRQQQSTQSQSQTGLRNIKLFSQASVCPGIGERVRTTAAATTTTVSTHSNYTRVKTAPTVNGNAGNSCTMQTNGITIPQRTETNL